MALLHEPVPRLHDEFSYLLLADTLAHGRVVNPAVPLPEFFETFHVITMPVYASKYFPAQGVFLAIGEKLTGHPVVGVWLSSALACAAIFWMLEAWIDPGWALLGALLMAVEYGIYGYWSQTYWGGMVMALGGALVFGAARRLWDKFSWKDSAWLALGVTLLVNSRPFESLLALLPLGSAFIVKFGREKLWNRAGFRFQLAIPLVAALAIGAFLTLSYNRAVTGSLWKTPYMLYEQQYQETPQLTFLPLHPKLSYSNPWLRYYFEVQEMGLYEKQRRLQGLIYDFSARIASWWQFYCGILLSIPLVVPVLLRAGRLRYVQAAVLAAMIALSFSGLGSPFLQGTFDLLMFTQIAVLWLAYPEFWPRIAIFTSALLICEALITKWYFPHYFAPGACLVLYLEVEGLRRTWNWQPEMLGAEKATSRAERRRKTKRRENVPWLVPKLRGLVAAIPLLCAISLLVRIESKIEGWKQGFYDSDRIILPLDDRSLRRAELEKWMESQPTPQLVFVRYSPRHNVNYEWVFNHADIMHSRVIWARDLGADHDRELLQLLPDRTVWLLEADHPDAQLVPYPQLESSATVPAAQNQPTVHDSLNW